jgi:NDP-sugar pyrophosphorylase family protein
LILLAAGLGTRFKGLKPLAPIGPAGESVIDYNAADAVRAGFGSIVLVVRSEIEELVANHVAARWPSSVPVTFVAQDADEEARRAARAGREKPLGTGHAVLTAAPAVEGPFAVANGDDIYGPSSFQLLADHLGSSSHHGLVGFRVRNAALAAKPVNRALCAVDDDGRLLDIEEGSVRAEDGLLSFTGAEGMIPLTGDELVSMNLFGLQTRIVARLQRALDDFLAEGLAGTSAELLLPDVLRALVDEDEPVVVLPSEERVLGITHGEDADAIRRVNLRPAW